MSAQEGQRTAALEKATQVRMERHRLRKHVRAMRDPHDSQVLLAKLLLTPHPELNTMRVYDLLRWSRGVGQTHADRLLYAIGGSPALTVLGLTVRQRVLLARLLRSDEQALQDAEAERLAQLMPPRGRR